MTGRPSPDALLQQSQGDNAEFERLLVQHGWLYPDTKESTVTTQTPPALFLANYVELKQRIANPSTNNKLPDSKRLEAADALILGMDANAVRSQHFAEQAERKQLVAQLSAIRVEALARNLPTVRLARLIAGDEQG